MKEDTNKLLYLLLFVLALGVNFSGINVNFFTDDLGLYASIAKNLDYKKDFFQLFTYNADWLDKPHFTFWAILLSFKIFGVSLWAYRLPALLFFIISLVYTYLFARKYYNWEVAIIAVLIVMTAQHVLLSNTDVRAEPYLMGLVMGSIYHISRLEKRFTIKNLLLAALLTACAIMTKGIFVLAAIYGALLGQLFFQNKLSRLFKFKWVLLLLLTFIFTLPEFYALYLQFDLHPEKTVFGTNHVSGIKWFLWDSQFGRFVNNGPINRAQPGSIFFFLHTLLWAFAPWCLLFYYVVFKNLRDIYRKKELEEYYTLSGGLLLFLLFSVSRFQLPFYTNAVFPLFAVVTAPFCCKQLNKSEALFRLAAQWVYIILLPLIIVLLNLLLKPKHDIFFAVDCVSLGMAILLVSMRIKELHKKVFFLSCCVALFSGFFLNTIFYNEIVPYKGEIAAAEYINKPPFDNFPIYSLKAENNIFQFYCKRPVSLLAPEQFNSFKTQGVAVFYASQKTIDYLKGNHSDFKIVRSFVNYPHENILPSFIRKATRHKVLDHVYLITR
ncbi:MAG TPA: glycosyltransferase family 39 protein [Mucilaginibacter sp.]